MIRRHKIAAVKWRLATMYERTVQASLDSSQFRNRGAKPVGVRNVRPHTAPLEAAALEFQQR